jgi:6-pyruvoyltetrahydropterin/6-carboxytetrahydropterin synthase
MQIYKEFSFEAAHALPSAPPARPASSSIHGHSFRVRITVEGEPAPETDAVLPFSDLAEAMAGVRVELDHRFLNEDVEGLGAPTLENLATWIWRRLEARINGLSEVHIWRPACHEGCIYRGPKA